MIAETETERERDLNGGLVSLETNDLSDELAVTHTNKLKHGRTAHLLSDHDCAKQENKHSIKHK